MNGDQLQTRCSIFLRLRADDEAPRELAWEEFRARYTPVIAGFARNLGARPQDVDDVIQDVMLGFFLQSPKFVYDPSKGRFRGYLKTCVCRALQRRLGQSAKFNGVPLEQVNPAAPELDALWESTWEHQQLRRAVEALREETGESRSFRAFEQYVLRKRPGEEVARELGMHVNSVYRAKEQFTQVLRERLAKLQNEED